MNLRKSENRCRTLNKNTSVASGGPGKRQSHGTGRQKQVVVISGPSGVGKTTVCDYLISREPRLKPCVTATTRPMRKGEINGRDYLFLNRNSFIEGIKNRKFVEYTRIFGHYYGTPVDSLESVFSEGKYPLLRIDVKGAGQLRQKGYQGVFIFILPPDAEALKRRLVNRRSEKSQAELNRRLRRAGREMRYSRDYDFQVVNDKISRAVEEIRNILKKYLTLPGLPSCRGKRSG